MMVQDGVMSLPNQSVQPSKLIFPIHINCEHDPKIAKAFRRRIRTGFNKMPTANRVKGGSRRVDAEVPCFRSLDFNGMQAEKCMRAAASADREKVMISSAKPQLKTFSPPLLANVNPAPSSLGKPQCKSSTKRLYIRGERGSPCRTDEQTAKGSEGPNVVMPSCARQYGYNR